MPLQNPVVVIPGITATSLVDEYPLAADTIWSMVVNKEYERVALHPDDLRYEAIELLPRLNIVQRLVTRHLLPRYRGEVWGRRVPGATSWRPPIADLPERPL